MTYLERFFSEKDLPLKRYEIDFNGQTHFITSEKVIEIVKSVQGEERTKIENTLRKIDFANGDVHDYLKFLATCYIKQNYS